MACIGADKDWNQYLVFVIANQYKSLFCGKNIIYKKEISFRCYGKLKNTFYFQVTMIIT